MTAVVIDGDGRAVGALPALDVAGRWWPDTTGPIAALRERFGLEATVVRLLEGTAPMDAGGARVTYAVEVHGPLPRGLVLEPAGNVPLGEEGEPRRMPWAKPGGVAADLAWADGHLAALGRPRTGPAEQVRSWNLSLLLRIPVARGWVWLKHAPPFMRHEARVIRLLDGSADVPTVLAADDASGRCLLDDVPGTDAHEPTEPLERRMVTALVQLQSATAAMVERFLMAGCPDWRSDAFLDAATVLIRRDAVRLDLGAAELAGLRRLLDDLPRRLDDLAACGLPETLVHGDFHPGNHRVHGDQVTLLDWGDSGVGHPLLDMAAFLERVPNGRIAALSAAWSAAWRDARPGGDPVRAAALIGPVAALRQALIYCMFLDNIEPSEQIYHRDDPALWLRRAIDLGGSPTSAAG